jgi:hypothetical protein
VPEPARAVAAPGGKQQSLVAVHLRHRQETPALPVQFATVEFFQVWQADQPPVVSVSPTVIGAGERRGIAGIGAAHQVAAMPADIQEGTRFALGIAHHQNRIFIHVGGEEIARLHDLALMAEEQPTAGEKSAPAPQASPP